MKGMSDYVSIFGSGNVLFAQIVVFLTIIISIIFVLWILWKRKRLHILRILAIPITLFFIFGTLDALITIKGTFLEPLMESNPLAKSFLLIGGWIGFSILTFFWITSFSLLALLIYETSIKFKPPNNKIIESLSLFIFYSLAMGHLFGFSSWVNWFPVIKNIAFGFENLISSNFPFLLEISPFGSLLYLGMLSGAILTYIHIVLKVVIEELNNIRNVLK